MTINVKTSIAYSGIKLSNRFQLKRQTNKDHEHDVVFYAKCLEERCTEDYTREMGMCLIEHVKDHSVKDVRSHLFAHSVETEHKMVTLDDFKIVRKRYKRSKFRLKLAESLHVKEKRSVLNTQGTSVMMVMMKIMNCLGWIVYRRKSFYLFPAEAIVRDSHHTAKRISTCLETEFRLFGNM